MISPHTPDPRPRSMHYGQAQSVIWVPDQHPLEEVAAAAEFVLATFGAPSDDVHQASHLITTMRPR